jgi:hypothetical protein
MGINAPLSANQAAASQLVVPAGGVKLAELSVGQLYRVTVTAAFPGKAEILIGNQYLLAATPFRFQPGDVITLKLIARSPELLQFQLTLPVVAGEQATADLTTLLRAAALPDTQENRAALTVLLQSGVPVGARAMIDVAQMLSMLPPAAVTAFIPVYKQLLERNIRLDKALLVQLARLEQGGTSLQPLAATLAVALGQLQRDRERSGQRRRPLEQVLTQALQGIEDDAQSDGAQNMKEQVALLYGSPEVAILQLLHGLSTEDDASGVRMEQLELKDLQSLVSGEELDADMHDALNTLQAIKITNALHPGKLALMLPLVLDGAPTDVQLNLQLLSEQYYHKDYALRIRVENETQGKVEFQLRTRGPGLYVDVLAEDEETLAAYTAEADRLAGELGEGAGFILRKLEMSQQTL